MKISVQESFQRTPMVFIAIGIFIGILFGKYIAVPISLIFVPINLFLIILIKNKWNNAYLLITVLSIIIGYSAIYNQNNVFKLNLIELQKYNFQKIEFEGIVQDISDFGTDQRYITENLQIKSGDRLFDGSFKYNVYPSIKSVVSLGDTITGNGKLELYKEIRNPGEFDFKKYYNNKHVIGRIYSKGTITRHPNSNRSLKIIINDIREFVRGRLIAYSDEETAALFSALIIGDRTKIDQDLRESFANVGVIHILAVSGLHVGYVLLILILIVRIARIPWGWDKIAIILGLVLFCLISGGRPSVIRASLMAGLYVIAPLFNRRPNSWNIISVAAVIILLFDPNAVQDLGFQLSFTAVISIVYFYSVFNKILPESLQPTNIKNNAIRFVWSLFLVSLSAQICTIPLTAFYFGRIPLIAVIANLVVIPLVGLFVAIGFVKLLIFWIPPLSYFFDQFSWLTKEFIYRSISIFDSFPYASFSTPQFGLYSLIIYALIILIGFSLMKWQINRVLVFGSLLFNLIVWPKALGNEKLDLIFLDLGNNESAIIKSNHSSVLINNGVHSMFSNDIDRIILPAIRYFNIEEFDHFVKPYGNSNYKVGAIKLFEKIQANKIWDLAFDPSSSFDNYLRNLAQNKGVEYYNAKRGDVLRINDKSVIQFLLPMDESNSNYNYALKLIIGEISVILFDQLNAEECRILLEADNIIKSDVVKLSYPKVLTNEMKELITKVGSNIMIVAGKRTSKYNPTVEELTELSPNQIYFTHMDGAIWLSSDFENIEVKNWK